LVGAFDAPLGLLSVTAFPCAEFLEGFLAVKVELAAQLSKSGLPVSGTITLTTAPFDCADGTVTTGPLTLTPLAQSHDVDYWAEGQSGPDGCSTWEELGTYQLNGGLRDPFNVWDFFDVPTGAWPNLSRNKSVTIADITAVNGSITTGDVSNVVTQFGHNCVAAP
jgi:hypothetical protein